MITTKRFTGRKRRNQRLVTHIAAVFAIWQGIGLAQPILRIHPDGKLSWSWVDGDDEYVVMTSDTVEGPWVLSSSIIDTPGRYKDTEVTFGKPVQFFRLVRGHQFFDLFDGPGDAWTDLYPGPNDKWTLTYEDALRIQYAPGTASGEGRTVFAPPEPGKVYGDAILSMDILDWDENASRQTIGMIARLTDWGYIGRINFNDPAFPGRASMAISLESPLVRIPLDVDPAKTYRLIFSLTGNHIELALFDREDLANPIAAVSTDDGTRPNPGGVGIWVNANWGESTMDSTVDNFVVTEALP